MGIKNLRSLIEKYANDAVTEVHLNTFKNKVVAIDTSIYMYKIKHSNNNKFIEGFIKQLIRLLRNQIIPLYIFDGKPPPEKSLVLVGRKTQKKVLKKKIIKVEDLIIKARKEPDILKDIQKYNVKIIKNHKVITEPCTIKDLEEECQKLRKRDISVTWQDFETLKLIFTKLGIPYITSNGEAEELCAKLCKQNIVHACMSADMDCLPFGACKFLRNFSMNKNYITQIDLSVLLEKLEVTHDQFIDICILSGCDYCSKISGIGCVKAHKLIKKYGDIETMIPNIKNKIPDDFTKGYEKARELFKCDYENIETYNDSIILSEIDPVIIEVLIINNVSEKTIKTVENSFQKYYNKIKTPIHNQMIEVTEMSETSLP